MGLFPLAVCSIVALPIGCWIFLVSLQSIRQARILAKPCDPRKARICSGSVVALTGRPELPKDEDRGPFPFPVLWYREIHRERKEDHEPGGIFDRRKDRSRSYFKTVYSRTRGYDFKLACGGEAVRVKNKPTEIHGTESDSRGKGSSNGYEVSLKWLPVHPKVTVLGRLSLGVRGPEIEPDRSLGMILTSDDPSTASNREMLKGVAGVVFTVCLVAFLAVVALGTLEL